MKKVKITYNSRKLWRAGTQG